MVINIFFSVLIEYRYSLFFVSFYIQTMFVANRTKFQNKQINININFVKTLGNKVTSRDKKIIPTILHGEHLQLHGPLM